MKQIFNFSAGPAMIPKEVLKKAKSELYNWKGLGISVMEISHRSEEFIHIKYELEQDLRELLNIPNYYKVLFCHGGARAQFSAIPMNLLQSKRSNVDYIYGGYWSLNAAKEAQKYCNVNIINVLIKNNNLLCIKPMKDWLLSKNSIYTHYCINETIDGISINEIPNFRKKILIADCSSMLLSKPLDISKYGIIYASSQKNIGPSGLTIVIVREDLINNVNKAIPSILNYEVLVNKNSMFNTPPTFIWYMSGLILKWLKKQGGLTKIEKNNLKKSDLLYKTIDNYNVYYNNVLSINRSSMNVPFKLKNKYLEKIFLQETKSIGLYALKGHKISGGIRASLYNAMPLKGVKKLVNFMQKFYYKNI